MLAHFQNFPCVFLIGNFPSDEENSWNNFVPSINLKFAELTRLNKNSWLSSTHSEVSNPSSRFVISLLSVTISHAHFTALSGSEIQETYFSGLQEAIIPGCLCSSEVMLPQPPISPAGLGVRLALASPCKHQPWVRAAAPAACALTHKRIFLNQLCFFLCYLETGMFVIMSGEN